MSGIAYCGIDFGVDCCTVAVCNDAFPTKYDGPSEDAPLPLVTRPTPLVIVNELGHRSTPTWIQCPQNDTDGFVVGATARDQSQRCEKRTVSAIKLALGHSPSDATMQSAIQSNVWTCSITEGEKKSVTFETHEPRAQDVETTRRTFSAQELATSVLKQLASDASSVSGRDVQGCVLSVAPNATKEENEAMVEAAKQAGFDEIAMLRSDVAVALAYGFDKQSIAEEADTEEEASASAEGETKGETKGVEMEEEVEEEEEEEAVAAIINSPIQRILVLDVGARSCTASILLCSDGLFQAVHTVTQEGVGGWYIDEALVSFCAKEFNRTSKTTDVTKKTKAMSKLRPACQAAKERLSTAKDTMMGVEALHEGIDFKFRLNTARFEAEVGDVLLATLGPIATVLKETKLSPDSIHHLCLAGGSSRIPKLRRGFYELMKRDVPEGDVGTINSVDPAEAVAIGLAIHAAQLFLKTGTLQVPTTKNNGGDANAAVASAAGVSVEIEGGCALEIIPKNAVLPLSMSFYATASEDGSFALTLLSGVRPLASDNVPLLELCQKNTKEVEGTTDVKVEITMSSSSLVATATFVTYDEEGEESPVGKMLEGSCIVGNTSQVVELDDKDVLLVGLVNIVSEYDAALVACVAKEEIEDLEVEDADRVKNLVAECRKRMTNDLMPMSKWISAVDICTKREWVEKERETFQIGLDEIMADYLEEDEENDDEENGAGGAGSDAEMD